MTDIQIKSMTGQGVTRIGVCKYPEQGRTILLGPELKSAKEIDQFIDDLIYQLNKARKHTKELLKKDESKMKGSLSARR